MIHEHQRLSKLPVFGVTFIEWPLEEVFEFFVARSVASNAESDGSDLRFEALTRYHVLFGEEAHITQELGSIDTIIMRLYHGENSDVYPMRSDEKSYNVYGGTRIARVASNPKWTLIEMPFRQRLMWYIPRDLAIYSGRPVISLRSHLSWQQDAQGPFHPKGEARPAFFHDMHVKFGLEGRRYLVAAAEERFDPPRSRAEYMSDAPPKNIKLVYSFDNEGKPLDFEEPEHYKKRLIKDRFNRNILCHYLDKLGIDPERTLIERDLTEPVLFTFGPAGTPVKEFPHDIERYLKAKDARMEFDGFPVL